MRDRSRAALRWCIIALALVSCSAQAQRGQVAPEAASGRSDGRLAIAKHFMVSAANPYATDAGLAMLRAGGSAVDAAIAVQLVLGLVEPQSSGLGGGAFLLHWHAGRQELRTYDGRETAPATATPDRFLKAGRPMPFDEAVNSGLSIGTPGVVRLLEAAHRQHGRLPWARLFEPAIALADGGFAVSQRLSLLIGWQGAQRFAPAARAYFFTAQGGAHPPGHVLKNPAYAATLRSLAQEGARALHEGPIAEAIVAAAANAPNHKGDVSLADLASYAVEEREPLCFTYRRHRVCGMGPPSSGGLAVAQTLKLLEPMDLGRGPGAAMRPSALHLIAEAEKLSFADRNRYVADPGFSPVPAGLMDQVYIAERRNLIQPWHAMPPPQPGVPARPRSFLPGEDATQESAGTSHVSIVDKDGNAVALTTTIEGAFGSGVWAAGFLLNNQLTDFSFRARDSAGRPIANRVEPGKRPRSSMAPTIVFDADGRLRAVTGSPGGSRIILYVIKSLIALIDWELDAQAATALPNFGSRGGAFELEYDPDISLRTVLRPWYSAPTLWHALRLKPFGHVIAPDLMTSGLHTIVVRDGRLEGGADPRREGLAKGD